MIESLLLMLWRHLLFYANEAGNNNVHPRNLSSSLAYSTQMGSTRGASRDTLNRVAMSLGGVMDAINVDRQVPADTGEAFERDDYGSDGCVIGGE